MNCQSCGGALKSGAKFCSRCGAGVASADSQGLKCPTCGERNRPGAQFCRQDGTRLVDAAAVPQESRAIAPVTERVASPAAPIVQAVFSEPPSLEPAPLLEHVQAEGAEAPSGGDKSPVWLALGALAVLAVIGGGYWLYKSRAVSPQVVEAVQVPKSQMSERTAAPESAGEVLEEAPASGQSETPSSAQSQAADAPDVQVGDRWLTEVVDHQDPRLNYRAERVVSEVGNDRIVTSVRTVGKDYVRSVEYRGGWALVATHLPSGATTTYSPALPYLNFPLKPGKSWQARVLETDAEGQQRVHEVQAKMESWETVQVPAGTFNALKIVLKDDISKDGAVVQHGQDVSWYAPDARRTVKTEETSFDPTTNERRRRTVSLVEYSLQNSGGAGASATNAVTGVPPAEVVATGGCPFEGCRLGNWTAREAVPTYDRPDGTVVGQLPKGEAVAAMNAEVRAAPRRAVVTNVFETDQQQGIKVGSVVYALYPLGEGAVAVWHEGRLKNGSIDLGLHFDTPIDANPLQWTWWVRVALPGGDMRWLKNPQGQFDGMDAFG